MSKKISPLEKAKRNQSVKKAAAPHLVVQARAGTGKTTTLVEGLNALRGVETRIKPSEQQAAVWEALKESKGAARVGFVAFNKKIAEELQRRVPGDVEASTMHSMGNRAVKDALGYLKVNNYRVKDLACEISGINPYDLRRHNMVKEREFVGLVEDLVSKCKMGLVDPTPENLMAIVDHYGLDIVGNWPHVCELTAKVLEACKTPQKDRRIDFDDMVWLPVVLDLFVGGYDLLLVDEAQDLGRCQQALAKKAGKRLVFVGDDRQAIYGFAGADSEALPRLMNELGDTGVGCDVLPLTVTRRCSKAVVERAQKYVPDFIAHESNRVGAIKHDHRDTYQDRVREGEMIISRINAPLVTECFSLINQKRKANIIGRDIGAGLIHLVNKIDKGSNLPPEQLLEALQQWQMAEIDRENNKRDPSDSRLQAISDKAHCVEMFVLNTMKSEEGWSVEKLTSSIDSVFADNTTNGIKLASIHKSKGLEAENTFLLEVPRFDSKNEWQRVQEDNLEYVALTRAMDTATYVSMKKDEHV